MVNSTRRTGALLIKTFHPQLAAWKCCCFRQRTSVFVQIISRCGLELVDSSDLCLLAALIIAEMSPLSIRPQIFILLIGRHAVKLKLLRGKISPLRLAFPRHLLYPVWHSVIMTLSLNRSGEFNGGNG
jgi:hypothetical protein